MSIVGAMTGGRGRKLDFAKSAASQVDDFAENLTSETSSGGGNEQIGLLALPASHDSRCRPPI